MTIDILVAGPHPDDAELGAGGTLARLAQSGITTGIIDLTRGELSSRGTPDQRTTEAENAARALGLTQRIQAGLPDGGIANTPDQRAAIIRYLRTLRPRVLIIPQAPDRHPDHAAAHALLLDANFQAGLVKVDDGLPPHRAATVLFYHAYADQETMPAFVQDVTETFGTKLAALQCYQSQFHNPGFSGVDTYVSSPGFWDGITARAAYWGGRIGMKYGEPFYAHGPLALDIAKQFL